MKKFLFVLCLALLLTLVCTSAMAAIDAKYTSNGANLSTLTKYNGENVSNVTLVNEPKCKAGSALIETDSDDKGPFKDANGNPVSHYYTVSVDPLHNLTLQTLDGKAPKCGENGQGKYVCSDCGAIDPNGQGVVEIKALPKDHTFSPKVYTIDEEPTCSKKGKKHQVCIYCGEPKREADGSIKYEFIDEHTFTAGGWIVEKQQTCKEGGLRYLICALCGEPQLDGSKKIIYDEDYKKPADHTFGNWIVETPATCKDGMQTRYCSVCNYKESTILPATESHKWVYSVTVTGSCAKDGGTGAALPANVDNIVAVKTCSVCGTKETLDHASAEFTSRYNNYFDHHKFTVNPNGYSKPAGCVDGANGFQDMICSVCGGTKRVTLPKKTSHSWGAWSMKVAPGTDGTQNGVWERHCTNYQCLAVDTYVGKTAPSGAAPVATSTAKATTAPTTGPSGSENYQVTSWSFNGSGVSGQVKGNVTYRTPGLGVNVIIYTPTGTFLATSTPVNDDGSFSVSAGGAVYAVSIQLKDNNKTYQTDGKYV